MDEDLGDFDDSPEVPPAPSPPILSTSDKYNRRRSPTPDRRRRRRSNSRSISPSGSRFYRRSRSLERERDRDRDRDREKDRDKDRDRFRERERERDRERDRDRDRDRDKLKYARRDRSRSRSRSKSRSESKELKHSPVRSNDKKNPQKQVKDVRKHNKNFKKNNFRGNLHTNAVVQPQYPIQSNAFKNDGSFMEMFKKMQEQIPVAESQPTTSVLEEQPVPPPPLMVGKRRGGRILKTGMVAKPKVEQTVEQPKDAWSLYMAEVKKYREVCCQEEDNTRPLVK